MNTNTNVVIYISNIKKKKNLGLTLQNFSSIFLYILINNIKKNNLRHILTFFLLSTKHLNSYV